MTLIVKPGDLIVQQKTSGWTAIKILLVDPWPDGSSSAHCLLYEEAFDKPTVESLNQAKISCWHAPINAGSFSEGWELIGNQTPTSDDLTGFIGYLKLTNFPRYVQFTGLNPNEIVRKSGEHYRRGCQLGDQGKKLEAIAEYSAAIDIFPLLYEAIDNRAFTYMELGQMREALCDFEQSLTVNPNGFSAFFSKGECLMKLGDLTAAEAIFQEGQSRFPEKHDIFTRFLEKVRALQG